jgi:hypothetical protein
LEDPFNAARPGLTQAGVQLHQHRQLPLALGLLGRVDLLLVHQQHVLRHHASDVRALRRTLCGLIITSRHA